jgi:hypothetical protein
VIGVRTALLPEGSCSIYVHRCFLIVALGFVELFQENASALGRLANEFLGVNSGVFDIPFANFDVLKWRGKKPAPREKLNMTAPNSTFFLALLIQPPHSGVHHVTNMNIYSWWLKLFDSKTSNRKGYET